MLSYKNIQAVVTRIILSLIAENTALINRRLESLLEAGAEGTVMIWNCLGVYVIIEQDIKGRWHLIISCTPGYNPPEVEKFQSFKTRLGTNKALINKRVLNDLNVWFHTHCRENSDRFRMVANNGLDQLDIRPFITEITLKERLLNTTKYHTLSLGDKTVNDLIDLSISIRRGLFNRLLVVVRVSTKGLNHDSYGNKILESLMPTHHGITRQFSANVQQEPVNDYIRQAIRDYLEYDLK